MQNYLLFIWFFFVTTIQAQIIMPAYQANQYRRNELPTINTTTINAITANTVNSVGTISNDGGVRITARGVVWNTSSSPTIMLSTKTIDGTGTGGFATYLTGLFAETTYYLRAYATNSVGTAYGNELSFTTQGVLIGDSYQGGIIAYVLQSGDSGYDPDVQHGLITAPDDQSSLVLWHNGWALTAWGTSLGTGNSNTNNIVGVYGLETNAARLCYDLILNGYDDWYLPSIDELNLLYINRQKIGGLTNNVYWSSSNSSKMMAYCYDFTVGSISSQGHSNYYYARAIRSF